MQQTSLEAFTNLLQSGKIGERQILVYNTIKKFPCSTDKEISKILGLPINSITPRRNELVKIGLVSEWDKRACKITKRKSITWVAIRGKFKTPLSDEEIYYKAYLEIFPKDDTNGSLFYNLCKKVCLKALEIKRISKERHICDDCNNYPCRCDDYHI